MAYTETNEVKGKYPVTKDAGSDYVDAWESKITANSKNISSDVGSGEDDTGAYKDGYIQVDGSKGNVAASASTYDGQSHVSKSVYTEKVSVDKNVTKDDDGTIYKDSEVMGSKRSISVAKDSDGDVSKTVKKDNPYESWDSSPASVTKVKIEMVIKLQK